VTVISFKDDLAMKLVVPLLPEVQNSLKITADPGLRNAAYKYA
jgi:hypothetical protein